MYSVSVVHHSEGFYMPNRDWKYLEEERRFIEDLALDVEEMIIQDRPYLREIIRQNILRVLCSPVSDLGIAAVQLPEGDVNRSAALLTWQEIAKRVAAFCARTEKDNFGRDHADWLLVKLCRELGVQVSHDLESKVITARVRKAHDRV